MTNTQLPAGTPLTYEDIDAAMDSKLAGITDPLETLRRDEHIETFEELIAATRNHINQFGHLQITTRNPSHKKIPDALTDPPSGITHIVVSNYLLPGIRAALERERKEVQERLLEQLEEESQEEDNIPERLAA
jgi:hypothetical protein